MKNLTLEELELLDGALNTYRETLEGRKDKESLVTLEELQNSIRQEWRYIKGWDIWWSAYNAGMIQTYF